MVFSWFAIGGAIDTNDESVFAFELSILLSRTLSVGVILRRMFTGICSNVIFDSRARDIFGIVANFSIEHEVIRAELIRELMTMSTLIIGIAYGRVGIDTIWTVISGANRFTSFKL